MFRRLLPALLCLITIAAPAGLATAQTTAPPLAVLNLADGVIAARDMVTFRLGSAPGTAATGTCTDWLTALRNQSWQLYVEDKPAAGSVGEVRLDCESPTVVRASVRLLYEGLPAEVLKRVDRPVSNIGEAFGGQSMSVNVGPPEAAIGPAQPLWVRNTATWQRAAAVATLLLGPLAFFLLVFRTNIARDPMPPQYVGGNVPCPGDCRPSYSLSRTQFLWWLFIVTMCFLVIVIFTGRTDTISSDTLVLLGIVSGTSLLAVTQDQRKAKDENAKRAELAADYQKMADAPAAAVAATPTPAETPGAPAGDAAPANPEPVKAMKLDELAHDVHNASRDFFTDVLTDANGLSVHRLQMLVWTAVLGAVFLVKTLRTMGMPELDDNLLILMGISSGTYFGFKINETQVPPAQTGTKPATG